MATPQERATLQSLGGDQRATISTLWPSPPPSPLDRGEKKRIILNLHLLVVARLKDFFSTHPTGVPKTLKDCINLNQLETHRGSLKGTKRVEGVHPDLDKLINAESFQAFRIAHAKEAAGSATKRKAPGSA
jgi:hypothetical protein